MAKLSWRSLSGCLTQLSESQLQQMLKEEISTHKRATIANRLHQRLCMVRAMRERREIMETIGV